MADNEPPTSVEEGTPFSLSAPFCEPSMLWKRTDGGRSSPGPVSAWRRGGRGDGVDVIGMGVPWLPWRHSVNAVPPDTLTASFRKKKRAYAIREQSGEGDTPQSTAQRWRPYELAPDTDGVQHIFKTSTSVSRPPLLFFYIFFFPHAAEDQSSGRVRGKGGAGEKTPPFDSPNA